MAAKLEKFRRQDGQAQAQDGGSPSSPSATHAADKSKILEAIAACQTSLTTRIEEVKIDISFLRQDMQQLRDRVGESEKRLSHVEDALPLCKSRRIKRVTSVPNSNRNRMTLRIA